MSAPITEDEVCRVLPEWDVGALRGFPGERGGMANPAVVVDTTAGRFFLKRRNPRYCAREVLAHDHALMEHLAAKGLCTPLAVPARRGLRWVRVGTETYELHPYVHGRPHDPTRPAQITAAGCRLAEFHAAAEDFAPPAPKVWPRYHDPANTIEALEWAIEQAGPERAEVQRLLGVARDLQDRFPNAEYAASPHVLVHGDWHPGNVKYRRDRLCAIFDLDWATRQPTLVDLADAVIFFAARRASPLDASDIRSLTQPFRLDSALTEVLLDGYASVRPIEQAEVAALPKFMLARWLWCRADPMRRKIRRPEALRFLLDGIWEPIAAISKLT
jgi:homoserine kinase type II